MDNQRMRNMIGGIFEDLANALETGAFGKRTRVGLTILGSEHGPQELLRGAELAQQQNPDLEVVVIGCGVETSLELVHAENEKEAHEIMDQMLLIRSNWKQPRPCTTAFPIGVATVGRVITPGKGREDVPGHHYRHFCYGKVTVAMLKNTHCRYRGGQSLWEK
jgi:hypothetical protein